MKVILNTGSTIEQGCLIKGGRKMTREYREDVAVCYLNPKDLRDLWYKGGAEYPGKVKVTTNAGKVVVFARENGGVSKGSAFIPRGPWANVVISSETFGTGSPFYKGMSADIIATEEEVLDCEELIESIRRGDNREKGN